MSSRVDDRRGEERKERRDDRRGDDRRDDRDRDRRDRDRDRDRRDRDRDREPREHDRGRDKDDGRRRSRSRSRGRGDEKRERKRRGMWDVDASGNTVQPTGGAGGMTAAMMQSHPMVQQQVQQQQQAMMTALLQQQAALTRKARRLHVSNLPPGLNKEALKELFNTTMAAAKLALDEQPCVNDVQMAGDSKFAFIEFRSVSEATNAMALDGMQLLERPLRVSRPNDYMAPPAELSAVMIPQQISSAVTSSNPPTHATGAAQQLAMMGGGLMGAMGAPPAITGNIAPGAAAAAAAAAAGANGISQETLQSLTYAAGAAAAQLGAAIGGPASASSLMSLSRRARRLHVGNLPQNVGLSTDMLKQFFNAALVSATLSDPTLTQGDGPVLDVVLGSEGKFGFVEFRSVAECTSCMALNNIELGGKQLRIERPRDYAPMPDNMLDQLREANILGNTSVAPDGKDLLAPPPPAAAMGGVLPILGAPPAALLPPPPPAFPPLDLSAATAVLVLANMITAAEAADPAEMAEVLDDTKGECAKHGPVIAIAALKPPFEGASNGVEAAQYSLKVLVQFESASAATACAHELHGKQFDGRGVVATFAAEPTFAALLDLPCNILRA